MPPGLFQVRAATSHSENVTAMAVGPRSGRVFASGGADGFLNLYSVTCEDPIYKLGPFKGPITCCAFDYSEEFIAFGTKSGTIAIVDLDAVKTIAMWKIPNASFTCVDFHPQITDVIVAGDESGRVYVFGSAQRNPLQQSPAHRGRVNCVKVCPQGDIMISCGYDKCIRVIYLPTGELAGNIRPNCLEFLSLDFHPIERIFAGCSRDRRIHIFDLDKCTELSTGLLIGGEHPECIRFSQDGMVICACTSNVVSMFRTDAPSFADHLQISVQNVHDMRLYSTCVVVASSSGTNTSLLMARTDDFRLLKKEEEKKPKPTPKNTNKVIDGSNLNHAAAPMHRRNRQPQNIRILADLQPKTPKHDPGQPAANEALYHEFKTNRTQYLAGLGKRLLKMGHIRDMIKTRGFTMMATEVASNGDGVEEFMTILQGRPESVRMDNAAVCIDALNVGFEVNAAQAINVLGLILKNIGDAIDVLKGEDEANVMTTLHSIAPVVQSAADQGFTGARELLTKWPTLLR